MGDDAILRTPGELLAEARAASGLSLAEIAERTKIPVPQLEAIERDEFHRLSGPLYVKSFLRSYADAVGVEVETVLDLYGRATGEGASRVTEGGAETWEKETVTITRIGIDWPRLLIWGAGGAVVVVLLWFGFRVLDGGGKDGGAPAVAPASTAVIDSTGLQPAAADSQAANTAVADSSAAPGDGASAAQGEDRPTVEHDTDAAALPPALPGSGPIPFTDGGRWPVRVRLLTAGPIEAEARSDGESRFAAAVFGPEAPQPLPARGIVPGRAYATSEGLVVYWHAADHVGLRLGATEGVRVFVNGEERDVSRLRPGQEMILDAHR